MSRPTNATASRAGMQRRIVRRAAKCSTSTTSTKRPPPARPAPVRNFTMRNIIQDLPCLEVEAGHGLITSELTKLGADAIATDRHFPDESRYGFRNPLCVMTKLDAVSAVTQLPRPGLIWSCPELESLHRRSPRRLPGRPLQLRRRGRPRRQGLHPSSTTSWTTNSASWTPSAYLNTPTTTTASTTSTRKP